MANLSKPVAVDLFNRDRQLVTRFQERRIRNTFPFLSLPPELRNIIYDLCLSFKGIQKFFDTYYSRIRYHTRPDKVRIPKHRMVTPSILQICRQIYSEAIVLLRKKEAVFHHGLLGLEGTPHVISKDALRKLGHIEINTKGHHILRKPTLRISWIGYMKLLADLASILSEGHSLKSLVIDLRDEGLALHTEGCWLAQNECDFRDHLKEALDSLRAIRGVGCVKIKGVNAALALKLKLHIESKPLSFLDLPGEIRNKIYLETADHSDISTHFRKTVSAMVKKKSTKPIYPALTTPTIFLLNKQITKEASTIIYGKPLHLKLPRSFRFKIVDNVPNITKFMSSKTLQKIQHLDINTTWEWVYCIESLFMVLARKHSIKSFRLSFKDDLKGKFLANSSKKYPDSTLHTNLSSLIDVRGVEEVIIEGDLPEVYTRPLIDIMTSAPGIKDLPTLKAICGGDGAVVDADAGE